MSILSDLLQVNVQSLLPIILIIALAGFISGLSGFRFSAVGVAVLWVLPPTSAIPLLMALSIANQLLSISQLKNDMLPLKQWWTHSPATYIVGGIFGIPFGIWVMANLPVAHLTFVTGIILVAYVIWMTNKPHSIFVHRSGTIQHLAVGMLGGAIGGFTAFPGCALVIWAGLKNMNKFDESFWVLFFLLLPVVLPMTNLGVFAFKKLSDVNFKSITLVYGHFLAPD